MKKLKIGLGIIGVAFSFTISLAQSDLVKFGAISRGVLQESTLDEADTTNPNRNSGGQTVVDLRMNINPNRKTEIGSVIRLQSELGGYFGAGSEIALRQLYVKGLLYDVVSYELGDIYLELSPYTLFNSDGELSQNEAKIFNQLRTDFSEYDNFNIGNSWWTQGGHVNFGFEFDSTESKGVQFDVFSSRIRAASTMRFMSGGRVSLLNKDKYNVKANVVSVFDAKRVTPLEESVQNTVASLEWAYHISKTISFVGESGMSNYSVAAPYDFVGEYLVPDDRNGEFINTGLKLKFLDGRIKSSAKYLRNSANFYSAGAQSKRLNFMGAPELFLNVANNPFQNRQLNIYDLIGNRNIYNAEISNTLMAYNPLYGNVLPYGEATPNRTGLLLDVVYSDSTLLKAGFDFALLSDVTGVGTDNKRSFMRFNAFASVDVAKLLAYKKDFTVGGSFTTENTSRDGSISAIDLKSNSINTNLEFEVFNKLYVLGGIKILAGSGNEFLYDLSDQNTYAIPASYTVNVNQLVTGVGARYQFSEKMYLSIKNFNVNVEDKQDDALSYAFNQWMLFFSLKL